MTDTLLFAGYALGHAVLLAWGIRLAMQHGWATAANVWLLVVAGLTYDNGLLALGKVLGEGSLLESLSLGRFWIHALVTPLLVLFAWHAAKRSGVGWAATPPAAAAAVGATVALIILELVTVVLPLEVEARREYGVVSYTDVSSADGPPLMVLFVAAALIVGGFVVWRRQGWPWLLVGAGLMTIGSAVEVPVESGAATNAFELVLLTAIVATKAHQDSRA